MSFNGITCHGYPHKTESKKTNLQMGLTCSLHLPQKQSNQMCEDIIDSKLKHNSEVFTIYLSFRFMPGDLMIHDNFIVRLVDWSLRRMFTKKNFVSYQWYNKNRIVSSQNVKWFNAIIRDFSIFWGLTIILSHSYHSKVGCDKVNCPGRKNKAQQSWCAYS